MTSPPTPLVVLVEKSAVNFSLAEVSGYPLIVKMEFPPIDRVAPVVMAMVAVELVPDVMASNPVPPPPPDGVAQLLLPAERPCENWAPVQRAG